MYLGDLEFGCPDLDISVESADVFILCCAQFPACKHPTCNLDSEL
jgi:hypothetical protein